jgi:hypothetical protein
MAGEPIVARTAWLKGGTTYVTIRWNGAVRTRVARPDGSGGWMIALPGLGDTKVILPATVGTEPTEGRLARGATMVDRLAAGNGEAPPARRSHSWQDLPPTSAVPQDPRDRTVFSQALKTIRARTDGATLDEIKESFREIDLYHHDPLTLLRWQHDNRGWGFRMNPATGRVTIWPFDGAPLSQDERDAPHNVTFAPAPASAPSAQRNERQAPKEADIEQRRSQAQAEWRLIEEERRRLERERQDLDEERRLLAAASNTVSVQPPRSTNDDLPAWLTDLPTPDRYVFQHIAKHGSINETEATQLLGGARQFRRFSGRLEEHLARVPFKVRIDVSGGMKCYVRDERGTE